MASLEPVAFDIETSGLGGDAVITVAGFAHSLGAFQVLNTDGQDVNRERLSSSYNHACDGTLQLRTVHDERALLQTVSTFVADRLDGDRHYLTAYNGETWNGGFDLPFCRTRYHHHGIRWPFDDIAYADMMAVTDRFDTDDNRDLVGVYDELIGDDTCDPFDDSGKAVTAFDDANWEPLLRHNLADIQRTRELAVLAGQFVPQSDFKMKNLAPPNR